jgi:hypothetical protein
MKVSRHPFAALCWANKVWNQQHPDFAFMGTLFYLILETSSNQTKYFFVTFRPNSGNSRHFKKSVAPQATMLIVGLAVRNALNGN